MATGSNIEDMVKAIEKDEGYKVLSKHEYEALLALASKKEVAKSDPTKLDAKHTGNTPEKVKPNPNPNLDPTKPKFTFSTPGMSPINRLNFNHSQPLNTTFSSGPYVPKLPFYSGSEEPQKGETSYEVWNFEVKCLQKSDYLPDHLLLQAIRNSLKGTARSMLVPLGESASVKDILLKLDGFYGNVSTSETLIQSFYSDYQKDTESIVAFGSRIEQTLSRAVRYGHIDLVAKDAMLRSKFWTGLKSQTLKNSTRHFYDSIKDFQTLLREIRKVDQEDASYKSSKKATQQVQSGNTTTDETSSLLLKQMKELMGRMETMEKRLEESTKSSSTDTSSAQYNSYNEYSAPRGRGRGWNRFNNRGQFRGGFGRSQDWNYDNSNAYQQRGDSNYRGGSSRGSHWGGTSARGANRGGRAQGNAAPLNE